MKTFKEFLAEMLIKTMKLRTEFSFRTAQDLKIFKNPKGKEIGPLRDSKGFVDKEGDMYIAQSEFIIHDEFLKLLKAILPINNPSKFDKQSFKSTGGVAIELIKNNVFFSESISFDHFKKFPADKKYINSLYVKAKKNNPSLNFIQLTEFKYKRRDKQLKN